MTVNPDKAAVAARLEQLLTSDLILARLQQGVTGQGEKKERRKSELASTVHQGALERLWLYNEIRRLKKERATWLQRSRSAKTQLRKLEHKGRKQATLERAIDKRKRHLKKLAVAQILLERLKQVKKNIQL